MSEPNAGSDLAGLTTGARSNGFVIRGQNLEASPSGTADYCYLVARTNSDAPSTRASASCSCR